MSKYSDSLYAIHCTRNEQKTKIKVLKNSKIPEKLTDKLSVKDYTFSRKKPAYAG